MLIVRRSIRCSWCVRWPIFHTSQSEMSHLTCLVRHVQYMKMKMPPMHLGFGLRRVKKNWHVSTPISHGFTLDDDPWSIIKRLPHLSWLLPLCGWLKLRPMYEYGPLKYLPSGKECATAACAINGSVKSFRQNYWLFVGLSLFVVIAHYPTALHVEKSIVSSSLSRFHQWGICATE